MIAILLLALAAFDVGAQTDSTIQNINDYYLDFSVPDLSAFTLMGVNPNAIARPGNTKELAANVLNIASGGKNITPGIAIEWSPYKTFETKENRTYASYKNGAPFRNMQISFGTIQDSLGSKVSLGFKWVFADKSDPLLDKEYRLSIEKLLRKHSITSELQNQSLIHLRETLKNIDKDFFERVLFPDTITKIFDLFDFEKPSNPEYVATTIASFYKKHNRPLSNDEEAKILPVIVEFFAQVESVKQQKQVLMEEFKEVKKRITWNKSVGQVGLGVILNSADQTWEALKSDKFSGFIGYSVPLTKYGQIMFQTQFTAYYTDSVQYKSIFTFGSRILFGSSDIRGSLEGLYVKKEQKLAKEDLETLRMTLGFEVKMANGLWLELAVGVNSATSDYKHSSLISLANVKYAFNKERRFNTQ